MSRQYTHVMEYAEEIFQRKAAGETNREIGEKLGLSKKQVKQLVCRENRKRRLIKNGYISRPQGRPRKDARTKEVREYDEIIKLKMQVELLRNFLYEAGRR